MLVARMPVRLVEISRNGCLLETSWRVDKGTMAEFRLEIDGRTYAEELRITRCNRVEGAGATYRVGAEFVPTRRLSESSLRRALYSTLAGEGDVAIGTWLKFSPATRGG